MCILGGYISWMITQTTILSSSKLIVTPKKQHTCRHVTTCIYVDTMLQHYGTVPVCRHMTSTQTNMHIYPSIYTSVVYKKHRVDPGWGKNNNMCMYTVDVTCMYVWEVKNNWWSDHVHSSAHTDLIRGSRGTCTQVHCTFGSWEWLSGSLRPLIPPMPTTDYSIHPHACMYTRVWLLSLIHIWRCRRSTLCRSRWSPYH